MNLLTIVLSLCIVVFATKNIDFSKYALQRPEFAEFAQRYGNSLIEFQQNPLNCTDMQWLIETIAKLDCTQQYNGYSYCDIMLCTSWIESNWEYWVVNSESGAAGLWQIMPDWCGHPNCPDCGDPNAFLYPPWNALCMSDILVEQGIDAWTPDPDTCVGWFQDGGEPYPSCWI